jgi:hypothetical protein
VPDTRVEYDYREIGRERHRAVYLGRAVKEESASTTAEDDRCGVHQTAWNADGAAFGLAHEARELERLDAELGDIAERQR